MIEILGGRKAGGRNKLAITKEQIEIMIKHLKEGKTLRCVGEIMGLHPATIHNYTKDIMGKRDYKRVAKADIIKELKAGKGIREVSELLGTNIERVERIYREKEKELPKKVTLLTKRQEEVKKISIEFARKKEVEKIEWQKQLESEKQYYAEKYKRVSI